MVLKIFIKSISHFLRGSNIKTFNITSTQEMANGFNEYFTNIGPNLASSIDDSNTSFRLFVKPAKSKLDRFKFQ